MHFKIKKIFQLSFLFFLFVGVAGASNLFENNQEIKNFIITNHLIYKQVIDVNSKTIEKEGRSYAGANSKGCFEFYSTETEGAVKDPVYFGKIVSGYVAQIEKARFQVLLEKIQAEKDLEGIFALPLKHFKVNPAANESDELQIMPYAGNLLSDVYADYSAEDRERIFKDAGGKLGKVFGKNILPLDRSWGLKMCNTGSFCVDSAMKFHLVDCGDFEIVDSYYHSKYWDNKNPLWAFVSLKYSNVFNFSCWIQDSICEDLKNKLNINQIIEKQKRELKFLSSFLEGFFQYFYAQHNPQWEKEKIKYPFTMLKEVIEEHAIAQCDEKEFNDIVNGKIDKMNNGHIETVFRKIYAQEFETTFNVLREKYHFLLNQ